MISNTQITAQPEYDIQFWNAMRNKEAREDILAKGRDISTGTYSMPTVAAGKVMNEIESPCDGIIKEIKVTNEEAIGYDQVLMLIEV